MSAPNTNVKKQERRHKTPLVGMVWAILFAAVLFVGLVIWRAFSGNEPGDGQPIDAEQAGSGAAGEAAGAESQ